MAYTINLTNGTVLTTIADGTVNTSSSSLTLIGKNYAGYGQFLDDNFVHILENAANSTAPSPALTGQLWWDSTNGVMKVQSGAGWKIMTGSTASGSQPTTSVKAGDLWFDTTNQQLKVYTGSSFIVVGPAYSSTTGTAGAIPETIPDGSATDYNVVSLYVENTRLAIFSEQEFVPAAPINTDFPKIYVGVTLSSTASSPVFAGNIKSGGNVTITSNNVATVTVANTGAYINGLVSASGNITGANTLVNGTLTVTGNVTAPYVFANVIPPAGGAVSTTGNITGGNLITTGLVTATGNIDGGNINTAGQVSATGNITGGNISTARITGTSISVSGNIDGGNLRTVGQLSATGNVTSAANISGTYFIGNGSQLTGLSAAVSVTKIASGTSEANIGVPNGNLAVTIGGVANVVVVSTDTLFGNILSCQSISKTGTNAVGNIGSSSNYFNRLFATATTALYADVAERFHADEFLAPGTVVELGGIAEITKSRVDLSENVFGVISTKPAYTMNGGAGEDDTHPPVAMTGRVPVKVVGCIKKGDRLVSAGNGLARSALPGEATAFNVIGRSLDDKPTPEEGTIEAIVTIK